MLLREANRLDKPFWIVLSGGEYLLFDAPQFALHMKLHSDGPRNHYIDAVGLRFGPLVLFFDSRFQWFLKPLNARLAPLKVCASPLFRAGPLMGAPWFCFCLAVSVFSAGARDQRIFLRFLMSWREICCSVHLVCFFFCC